MARDDGTLYNSTAGSRRELVDSDEAYTLESKGVLVRDRRRVRPRYFDGRFLTAQDLTRDQTYVLTRQADLAAAGGWGVTAGLGVERVSEASGQLNPTLLDILPGHGVTPAGELVVLGGQGQDGPKPLRVDLAAVPTMIQLDAAFGLRKRPNPPASTLSGLFILALRPVEWTANPRASYPTRIDGARTVEDGDIIEGTVVTLIPYPDGGSLEELDRRRANAAAQIFVDQQGRGVPADALPLAMIGLDRGQIRWLDPYLVRREAGATHDDVLSLGLATRAVREAFVLQHDQHLQDVLGARTRAARSFAAADVFDVLPPVGRMPASALNIQDLSQSWFPPEVDVDISFVPEDELAVLVEESLLLPPIDLRLSGEALAASSVLVLVPVPRAQFRRLANTLDSVRRSLVRRITRIPLQRSPFLALSALAAPRIQALQPAEVVPTDAWAAALAGAGVGGEDLPLLTYVRRRNLSFKVSVTGRGLPLKIDERRSPEEPRPVEPTPVEPTPVEPTPEEPTPEEPTPIVTPPRPPPRRPIIKEIEGIDLVLGRALERAGLRSIEELAAVDPRVVKVSGVSAERLTLWKQMATLMDRWIRLTGNDAELLVRGAKLGTVDAVRKALEAGDLSLTRLEAAAKGVKLPIGYDPRHILEALEEA